jgi:NarL family two-component system response regulator LiaR
MTKSYGRTSVVLDQHPLWLRALEDVVGELGIELVGTAGTPEEALALVLERKPDLLIASLDTRPGTMDGVACLTEVRACAPETKTIALSASDDRQRIEAAFAAGAVAYVVKTADRQDLAAAIRQAFSQSIHTPPARSRTASTRPEEPNGVQKLTPRELEILRLVAEGASNLSVARAFWVTEQTVKFHLSNIYRKLGVANRTEASRWAHAHGLLAAASTEHHAAAESGPYPAAGSGGGPSVHTRETR